MPLWNPRPSWLDIQAYAERLFGQRAMSERSGSTSPISARSMLSMPSLGLINRRIQCVRRACDLAEQQAGASLLKRFSDLDIRSILADLMGVVTDMAMIVVGSALTGATVGGGLGFMAAGVGAAPGALAGALLGVQAGTWLLGILGLASLAEFFTDELKPIVMGYLRGARIAWQGPQERNGNPLGSFSNDEMAAQQGAVDIAQSHEAVVVLLLGAMVAYFTRGRGTAQALASDMRRSERGASLGQWMVKHEDALKQHPDLKAPEPRRSVVSPEAPEPRPKHATDKEKEALKGRANAMPLHEVDCFDANRLPASKWKEFRRQLKDQQSGLNQLTVEEYLKNIDNPVKRSSAAAKEARSEFSNDLQSRFYQEFLNGMDPLDAEAAAKEKARQVMSQVAGLHNPDLSAGGKDVIGGFGDRRVNSSIGAQWKRKIQGIREAAETVPKAERGSTMMNVRLHRCPKSRGKK